MEFVEFLKSTAKENRSIVCMGLDPVIERIPFKGKDAEETILRFYSEIFSAFSSEQLFPSAVKPNYAFFAQYGFPGLRALRQLILKAKELRLPVVFDGKRGDIGKSSAAYAKEVFAFWEADAVTVSPFMGSDSIKPFIEFCEKKGNGVYVLNRTSNPGAKDFQDLKVEGKPLFLSVSKKILEWGSNAKGNLGAVIGATSLNELKQISEFFFASKKTVPFLVPGVGSQGGSAREVVQVMKSVGLELSIQRINSSSGLNYAFEKTQESDFAGATVKALRELNKEIGFS
jgi:orotidine-5'-phosphate decarboxylase